MHRAFAGRCRTKERPDTIQHRASSAGSPARQMRWGAKYSRQRPTLPQGFPCSTIGGSRLDFRVRNGNGYGPAPMTTGKGSALDSAERNAKAKSYGNARRSGVSRGKSPVATSRERRDVKEPRCLADARRASLAGLWQLNILQTAEPPDAAKENYGQASRLISTAKLRMSPPLHLRPITWSSSRSL